MISPTVIPSADAPAYLGFGTIDANFPPANCHLSDLMVFLDIIFPITNRDYLEQ